MSGASDGTSLGRAGDAAPPGSSVGRPGPAWRGDGTLAPRPPHPDHRAASGDEFALDVAVLAPFGRRAAGHVLDRLIVGLPMALIAFIAAPGASLEEALELIAFPALVVEFGYNWVFNALGWSPGKRVVGLRLVTGGGLPPGVGRGLTRTIVSILSGLVLLLGLGYWWALWDRRRQTWHDKAAGTYVVFEEAAGPPADGA